jgi:hypothetical protein
MSEAQYHIFCIRVSGHVVEELVDAVACFFSRSSLLACNSRECHEDSRNNSTCIVEEAPHDLLDAFLVGIITFGTCVDWVDSLIVLAIFDWNLGCRDNVVALQDGDAHTRVIV